MKNIAITIFIVLIIIVMSLYLVSFQVRQVESALVTTFGKPTRGHVEPGWYFKWPAPIERVHRFDSRMRILEADVGETTTKGAMPIIVSTYVVWKIAEPLNFFNAVGTVKEAESKLISQINDTQNKVIGQHYFGTKYTSTCRLLPVKLTESRSKPLGSNSSKSTKMSLKMFSNA
jgi:membrane protease subunit HflC